MVRNRKSYLDVLKGIGAILVVLGHLVCYDGKIKIYIYSFHMPLFFFISGYLFKFNSNLSEFIRKKFKRLMVPYFIYTIISMIVVFSIDGITISKREIFYNFFFIKGSNYWNSSLWFLVVMFFVLILFNFLIYFKKRYSINLNKQYLFFFILLLLVSIILVTFNVKLIFGLEIVPHALLIFYIGYLFRKYDKYVKKVCLKLNINKKVKFI
ncbi:MAG: acyltransferase family protein [Bacilli bacterium]|nr:acyltransferase family protein [Bacilli bacterium]